MIKNADFDTITEAADLIKSGEVVAFPTETVYGLGADATNVEAVSKIYTIKDRPSFNPLIVHVCDIAMAKKIAQFSEIAETVTSALWPGPLTVILPRCPDCEFNIPDITTAGLNTVALRVPSNTIARDLIKQADTPIAAPSANKSGNTSATSAFHVAESLGSSAPFILAGGSCDVGLESTILDLTTETPTILRPGSVTIDDLTPLVGLVQFGGGENGIKSPGQLKKHYATKTPIRLNAVDVKNGEALLAFGKTQFMGHEKYGFAKDMPKNLIKNLSVEGDLHEAANHLFSYMRDLDKLGVNSIAVMSIPENDIGIAINDRLKRAAVRDEDA